MRKPLMLTLLFLYILMVIIKNSQAYIPTEATTKKQTTTKPFLTTTGTSIKTTESTYGCYCAVSSCTGSCWWGNSGPYKCSPSICETTKTSTITKPTSTTDKLIFINTNKSTSKDVFINTNNTNKSTSKDVGKINTTKKPIILNTKTKTTIYQKNILVSSSCDKQTIKIYSIGRGAQEVISDKIYIITICVPKDVNYPDLVQKIYTGEQEVLSLKESKSPIGIGSDIKSLAGTLEGKYSQLCTEMEKTIFEKIFSPNTRKFGCFGEPNIKLKSQEKTI
jgi:hypothetical protein